MTRITPMYPTKPECSCCGNKATRVAAICWISSLPRALMCRECVTEAAKVLGCGQLCWDGEA